jgi:hypothetical protein
MDDIATGLSVIEPITIDRHEITEEEILAERTKNGGWSRDTLAQWGVPWPPPKGWKQQLIMDGYPYRPASPENQ